MIKSWKSRDLKDLFEKGASRRIDTKLAKRCVSRLAALNAAKGMHELLPLPGYETHKWKGYTDKWSISVSGPWRITFNWINGDAYDVDLEQPHG